MVKEISATETFSVRQPVLRAGKPIESCHFDGDQLDSTKHFGYFENGNLIGIASMFAIPNTAFDSANQFQLRGMAVLPNHQKKGIGEQLVAYAENDAKKRNADLIWFNAREIAVGFYQKLGYEIFGKPFEIADIGPHYIMFKRF
ncbi:GNAT family N-acetyltransferase [Flavobacterium sp.]|uniref:GNAT family N-acetyltransferase n=1 Tax=Flavobacterium sp. TaxID=239 RepID=UPI0039E4DC5D